MNVLDRVKYQMQPGDEHPGIKVGEWIEGTVVGTSFSPFIGVNVKWDHPGETEYGIPEEILCLIDKHSQV